MPVDLFTNAATTTLAGTITAGATTLTVASSAPFPVPVSGTSQFRVLIDSEYLLVTNVTGTTWTVTRGAEGSTPASHSSGAPVSHVVTAGALANATSVPSASTAVEGTVRLAGDLAGTAQSPTVPGLAAKADATATTTALAGKETAGAAATAQAYAVQRANHTGTQAASTVTGLATVATSGAYTDLTAKPAIPAAQTVTTKTAAYTAVAGDVILANAVTAGFTITLPAAATTSRVVVKKIDGTSNVVTVTPASGTVEGAVSAALSTPNSSRDFVSDGTNWFQV